MADTTSDKKKVTLADFEKLAEDKSRCTLVINNRVYDVTDFLHQVCY